MPRHRKSKATYCGRKIRYRDRKDAKRARQQMIGLHSEYLRYYKCPDCGGFHLTHQKEWRFAA